jgi:hypothetical protein
MHNMLFGAVTKQHSHTAAVEISTLKPTRFDVLTMCCIRASPMSEVPTPAQDEDDTRAVAIRDP